MSGNTTVPKSQLAVTMVNTTNSTVFTLQSPVPGTPIWESVMLSQGNLNVQSVTVQPVDSFGNPIGPPVTVPNTNPLQPLIVNFSSPVTADKLVVTLTPINNLQPITADIIDVTACMPLPG